MDDQVVLQPESGGGDWQWRLIAIILGAVALTMAVLLIITTSDGGGGSAASVKIGEQQSRASSTTAATVTAGPTTASTDAPATSPPTSSTSASPVLSTATTTAAPTQTTQTTRTFTTTPPSTTAPTTVPTPTPTTRPPCSPSGVVLTAADQGSVTISRSCPLKIVVQSNLAPAGYLWCVDFIGPPIEPPDDGCGDLTSQPGSTVFAFTFDPFTGPSAGPVDLSVTVFQDTAPDPPPVPLTYVFHVTITNP